MAMSSNLENVLMPAGSELSPYCRRQSPLRKGLATTTWPNGLEFSIGLVPNSDPRPRSDPGRCTVGLALSRRMIHRRGILRRIDVGGVIVGVLYGAFRRTNKLTLLVTHVGCDNDREVRDK